jgi:hypothetical protein
MTDLPPKLAAFAYLFDAQPAPARDAFNYCLALMMVEAGKARLVRDSSRREWCECTCLRRRRFSLPKPVMRGGLYQHS